MFPGKEEGSCAQSFVVYFSMETLDTMKKVFKVVLGRLPTTTQSLMHLDPQLTVLWLISFL